MKKIYGIAFASAALMLASCSSDEPAANTQTMEAEGYIALQIVGDNATRALEDTEWASNDQIKANENVVNSVTVLLFNGENLTQAPITNKTANFAEWVNETDNAEKLSQEVVVVEKGAAMPNRILVVLNSNEDFSGKTLSMIQSDYNKDWSTGFVMSNSQYKTESGIYNVATPITEANIQTTPDAAKKNPVVIPVERVIARVDVKEDTDLNKDVKKITFGGETTETTVKLKIDGVYAAKVATKSNLLKNIGGKDYIADFNDYANFRYDWAHGTVPAVTNKYSWNDVYNNNLNYFYLQENTTNTAATNTKLLLCGTLTTDGTNGVTIVNLMGTYYKENDAKQVLCNLLEGYTINRAPIAPDDIEFITTTNIGDDSRGSEHAYQTYAQLKENKTVDNDKTDEVNTKLKARTVLYWNGGKTYYYLDINHTTNYDGVVRNFIYDYTINSVVGLGTPVVNPGDIIDPEYPTEEESYVAAQVKILRWKVVKRNANFGK